MKVSINWLKDLVDVNVSIEELAAKFNLHSAEVEDFYKLVEASNLVVGHVTKKEKHPNADKLSICQVDLGGQINQIVCGAPNVDEGQKVIVALPGAVLPGGFKIKGSTIRDVESNGMICSLSELGIDKKYHNEDGIHVLNNDSVLGNNAVEEMLLKDDVLDLDITPNRADLMSVMGVAYDTSAILNTKLHLKEYIVKEDSEVNPVKIKIDTENCMSYYARVLKDIVIKESPRWMQSRLIASGMRPINNVVDITNYVMLETGQPLHAFDYDLLENDIISVRMANKDEKIITLDEKERTLLPTDIVITNDKKAVALGGVMGGFDTEIIPTSKRILLESATFDPYHIRITSSRLDLRSEASNRFERKVDPKRSILALEMATSLFIEYAGGKALKGISKVDNVDYSEINIELSLDKINSYLGSDYSLELIIDTLEKLKFDFDVMDNIFNIVAPSRRRDILTYQDIIEEIGRIIGYDKLPLTLPKTVSIGKLSERQSFTREIRRILTGLGLNEVITYSLINEEEAYDFVKEESPLVKLLMPMSMDKNVLTHTPLNGILDSVKYNLARKNKDIMFFELGKKYETSKETELLCGALTGDLSSTLWQGNKEVVDFYLVKGILETLFNKLGLGHLEFVPMSDYKNLHPGQSAYIMDRFDTVGFMGKLHPSYENENDLKDVFVFEINFEEMLKRRRPLKKAKAINKFPSIYRDIALVVDTSVTAKELSDSIKKSGKRMLASVEVFDLYVGDSLGKNKKSVALRLEFSDQSKTLEMSDVEARIKEILGHLSKLHGALQR
jgi:phenylalanyl-tRNA synthetase beta chain